MVENIGNPLYSDRDIHGRSQTITCRVPRALYDQTNDLYEELNRIRPGEFRTISDVYRYGLMLANLEMTKMIGDVEGINYVQQAEILRKINSTLEFELNIFDVLAAFVENLKIYANRYGPVAAKNLINEEKKIIENFKDKNIKQQALDFLNQEFKYWEDIS
mgnify:CR=1 FL=1|jgi:hypothetical protein